MKFYSDLFEFDISIVRCLGGYFFSGHSVYYNSFFVIVKAQTTHHSNIV